MTSRISDDPLTTQNSTPAHTAPASISPPVKPFERHSFESHARTKSTISQPVETGVALPRNNRFSVSFPVQASRTASPIRTSHSPVREAPSVVPESLALLSGPSDTNFLTAIAAQERRVLELKEELAKAEAELNKLKRHWAQHEAQRKRDDAKRVTKLQPLQTSLQTTEGEDDIDGSNAWMQQEMERRKALLHSNPSSSRTVFSGSRHMRTLSLLSPIGREQPTRPSTQLPSANSPDKITNATASTQRSRDNVTQPVKTAQVARVSTMPNIIAEDIETVLSDVDGTESALDKEMLLRTSKKMATDLRDGLWTFWEDLRQATVGEEATKVEPYRPNRRAAKRQGSKTSLRASSKDSSGAVKSSTETKRQSPTRSRTEAVPLGDSSFWSEHGVSIEQQATPAKVKKTSPAVRHAKSASKVSSTGSSDNEGWDAWEEGSPLGSRASSSAASEANTMPSTVSNAASPRTSSDMPKAQGWTPQREKTSPASNKKDPIPWPALSNLGPKALRRTASHLMAEWEKSLTPTPTKEGALQDDYLGLGAEAAAAAVPSVRKSD